jgi:uncharacterized protein (DUF1778 family)
LTQSLRLDLRVSRDDDAELTDRAQISFIAAGRPTAARDRDRPKKVIQEERMFKLSAHFMLPVVLLLSGPAGAQTGHVVDSDAPARLYAKCTTVGTKEYNGRQCIAFRTAANQEIADCMSKGAANSHGYRALRVICADEQARRFTSLSE